MTTYDLGDTVPLSVDVTDSAGVATNCSTMVLTVTLPDGSTATPSTSNAPTGTYFADYVPATAGLYRYRFAGTVPYVAFADDFRVVGNQYATIDDLKSYLGIGDTVDDDELYIALDAAMGAIDRHTGRSFYRDTTTSTRLFDRQAANGLLSIDDVATSTGLAVATSNGTGTYTTLATTSWQARPLNASTRGWPITSIQVDACYGSRSDLYAPFQVTATWGWPAVPAEVTQATLILAARLFKRRQSPEGVAGFSDLGVVRITAQDVDVARLLAPYTPHLVA